MTFFMRRGKRKKTKTNKQKKTLLSQKGYVKRLNYFFF